MPILCRVCWPGSLDRGAAPFTLGRFSWAINAASLAFIALMSVLFVLPTVRPVTPTNMNYAAVAIGGLLVLVSVQYVLWGRHVYNGVVHTHMRGEVTHEREKES